MKCLGYVLCGIAITAAGAVVVAAICWVLMLLTNVLSQWLGLPEWPVFYGLLIVFGGSAVGAIACWESRK